MKVERPDTLPWEARSFRDPQWSVGPKGVEFSFAMLTSQKDDERNATFAAHAANAYDRLVDALKASVTKHGDEDAENLLRELGEL